MTAVRGGGARTRTETALNGDEQDTAAEPQQQSTTRSSTVTLAASAGRALRAARADASVASSVESTDSTDPIEAEPSATESDRSDDEESGAVADQPVVDQPDVDEPDADADADADELDTVRLTKSGTTRTTARPARARTTGKAATRTSDKTASKNVGRKVSHRSGRATPARRRTSPITGVLLTTMVLALAFAVIAGVVWWRAGHSETRTNAAARDAVILDARLDITAVNTSDYRQAPAALTKWLSVSTGTLHDQFSQSRGDAITLLKKAQIVSTATVLDAAVTELDVRTGKATVIASVDLRKQPAKGSAVTQRNRVKASMTRVDGSWKLSNLGLVSVQLS